MNKNDFAPRPPMGWNSYDYYDTTVNEFQVRANAAVLAEKLRPFGWEYVVVDIQWYAHGAGSMREQFQYIPFGEVEMDGFSHRRAPVKGCRLTADMVADPSSVCRWNPDMYGVRDCEAGQVYYDSLLELYASWGVDFIKCDDICNTNNQSAYGEGNYAGRHEIEMLARAIEKQGRPIVLSLSPGPALIERYWHYKKYANMWRITDDLWDKWPDVKAMFARCELWQDHVEAGCYPDCDMLPLGQLGSGFGHGAWSCRLTREEQRTMVTLWCLFGSPLMVGAELTELDDWTLSLLTNREVLAMLPARPRQLRCTEEEAVWTAGDGTYLALFNLADSLRTVSVFESECSGLSRGGTELWTGKEAPVAAGRLAVTLGEHSCAVYRMKQ